MMVTYALETENKIKCCIIFVLQVLEFADPCSFDYVYAYLNRPDVQEALHANVTKLTHDWDICSSFIKKWKDSPSTVIPLLRELMANGLRVWIYR